MIALLLCGILPRESIVRERVDLIEVNHFYDEHARLVFQQVIFYDWIDNVWLSEIEETEDEPGRPAMTVSRYQVRAWRLVKNPSQIPFRDWENRGYAALWQDGEVLRRVSLPHVRETWTQYDPELLEREYLPKERRRELRTVLVGPPSGAQRP